MSAARIPALYIIPLIRVTHIFGGVGLLIPNVPRLTEWVYAGIAIDLLLAFYSQMNGGGSTWDKFDPILVLAFVFASYVSDAACAQTCGRYEEYARRAVLLFRGTSGTQARHAPSSK